MSADRSIFGFPNTSLPRGIAMSKIYRLGVVLALSAIVALVVESRFSFAQRIIIGGGVTRTIAIGTKTTMTKIDDDGIATIVRSRNPEQSAAATRTVLTAPTRSGRTTSKAASRRQQQGSFRTGSSNSNQQVIGRPQENTQGGLRIRHLARATSGKARATSTIGRKFRRRPAAVQQQWYKNIPRPGSTTRS